MNGGDYGTTETHSVAQAKLAATHDRSEMHALHMSALRRKSGWSLAAWRHRLAQALLSYAESKHDA